MRVYHMQKDTHMATYLSFQYPIWMAVLLLSMSDTHWCLRKLVFGLTNMKTYV